MRQRSGTNIHISNVIGAGSLTEPAILATPACVVDSLAEIQVPTELKSTDCADGPPTDNPEFKRFRFRATDQLEFAADVRFLKHVIKTLIENHHITTDVKDLNDVLSYYGDVEVRTDRQVVQHRGVKRAGLCSSVDADEVIDIVQKVLVNGVNIVKRVPDFVQFLSELGLTL